MSEIHLIPLPEIDESALEHSIAASGLRMPIEVYALPSRASRAATG
jgi:hypothetical protein